MKTRAHIEAEARQLELRGRQEWAEHRHASAGAVTLFRFPESAVTVRSPAAPDGIEVRHLARHIEMPLPADRPEFRPVEVEQIADSDGFNLGTYPTLELMSGDNAFEVLQAGYERLDEDRLRERIEPIIESIEHDAPESPVTEAAIAEVEAATADMEFMPAARMRMRADAIAMLEGKLERGDFIARTVHRQQCYASALAMAMSPSLAERIEVS